MKIENDIRKFLLKNSLTTFACVAVAIASLAFHYFSVKEIREEAREHVYMINEAGKIIPTEYMNRRNNIHIELKNHLSMLVDNFYTLNQNSWEDKVVNKAFWLADVENIHKDRTNRGYYNRFIQYNIEQHATLSPQNVEIKDLGNDHFEFKMIVNLYDNYQQQTNYWIVFSRGKAKLTDRNFPHNPHGIWIYEYIEDKVERVIDDK